MKRYFIAVFAVLVLASAAVAQDIKFPPDLDKLSAKAKETVDVTLDGQMLQLASGYLSEKNSDEAEAKQLVQNLKGIYVRSFEFDKAGEYSQADIEFVRAQLHAPIWSRIVQVKDGNEQVEVYLKNENGQIGGLMVISAEPRELTFVNIVGPIRPDQLNKLSGHFGIPDTGEILDTGGEDKSAKQKGPKGRK